MKIKKLSIQVGKQSMHMRIAGSGAALVLLHPSPSSSRMFVPFMEHLSAHFTVMALDTPGYGASQPLIVELSDIESYARFFRKCFDELGLEKFALYGSATGAQIAIRYGLCFPEQVSHLYLDNTADFSEEETASILENYFPDLTPQEDGSHLQKTWEIVSGMFSYFPWFSKEEKHKLDYPTLPSNVLHTVACDFLVSGSGYSKAYRAAFEHEKAAYVKQLSVPTSVFRWKGSIILPYTDRLLAHSLPTNVQAKEISADNNTRLSEMTEHIHRTYLRTTEEQEFFVQQFEEIPNLATSNNLSISPSADGSHLIKSWNLLKSQYPDLDLSEFNERFVTWMQASTS